MSLRVGPTLSGGIDRVVSRNGLVLLAANLLLGTVWMAVVSSLVATTAARYGVEPAALPFPTLPLPLAAGVVGGGVLLAAFVWLNVVTVRTFVDGRGSSIPGEFLTRRIGYVFVNLVGFGVLFGLAVSGPAVAAIAGGILVGSPLVGFLAGLLLLVVPGLVAYVALLFGQFYVVVDDENALAALADSWSLTRGNWIRLFAVLLVVGVAAAAVSLLVSFGGSALLGRQSVALQFANSAVSYVVSLVSLGVLAEAFCRLRRERGEPVGHDAL